MAIAEGPRERLRRWVETQPSKVAAARQVGCHATYLNHLLSDGTERRPGLDVAFGIERATEAWEGGQIKAKEWAAVEASTAESESLDPTGS